MLKLENVSLFYEEGTKALSDITLQIKDGECLLLTGESGSGKSSMINVINGLAYKYENAHITGSIQIDGKEIKELELYEIAMVIASVFQNPKTHFFHVNTTQELLFYLENMGVDRLTMKARMEDMLGIFPIEHLLDRSIFELSGGEKQVLCVASSYISGCRIIVLDEPTSNLDGQYIDILQDMLAILKSKGITLIIAEHRMYYLMDIVDRIVLINKGRIGHIFDRDEFLSVSKGALEEWGIRSIHKVSLDDKAKQGGQDLRIRKLMYEFCNHSILHMENIGFALGKIYALIGRNGCGKSTFLRVMTGLEGRDKSEILFGGRSMCRKESLQNSALVMQDVNHQLFADTVHV